MMMMTMPEIFSQFHWMFQTVLCLTIAFRFLVKRRKSHTIPVCIAMRMISIRHGKRVYNWNCRSFSFRFIRWRTNERSACCLGESHILIQSLDGQQAKRTYFFVSALTIFFATQFFVILIALWAIWEIKSNFSVFIKWI